jgi:hypothetical protein
MRRRAGDKPHGSGAARGPPMICASLRADMAAATAKERPLIRSLKTSDWRPGRRWKDASSGEEDHAFIMRVRISTASEGGERRPQFSIEDVSAGRTERFATYELAAESLARSVQRIVSGPPGDKVRS